MKTDRTIIIRYVDLPDGYASCPRITTVSLNVVDEPGLADAIKVIPGVSYVDANYAFYSIGFDADANPEAVTGAIVAAVLAQPAGGVA